MKKRPNALQIFFSKFPQLMLAGGLFSLLLAACMSLSVGISFLTGFNNVIVWALGIVPATLFYPGLVLVIRKYAVEKRFVPVLPTFFRAVRENWKAFLLHGFVVYVICACSFFAILYYFTLSQSDFTFSYVLTIYIMFTAILLVMLFYVPIMTVTYDIRLRDVYKNSLLLVFGKILRNLLTVVMLAFVAALAVTALMLTDGAARVAVAVIAAALLPLVMSYIVIAMISKGLQENMGSFLDYELLPEEKEKGEEDMTLHTVNEEDDYIFVNGRMIKNPNKK